MNIILAQESRDSRNSLGAALRFTRFAQSRVADVATSDDLLRFLEKKVGSDTLVLLDSNLPGVDVHTLLELLQIRGMLDQVSILLCVDPAQVPFADQAVRLGARGFLVRPFSQKTLCAKIEEVCRARSAAGTPEALASLGSIVKSSQAPEALPPLLGLPPDIVATLFKKTSKARYNPGMLILKPGAHVGGLPFICRGQVEIVSSEGTDDRLTRGVGECFAERAFICGEPARISVRALTAVDVVTIPRESVVTLARRNPALQNFFVALLTRRPATTAPADVSELSSKIASLPFPELLQVLSSTRKTGVLMLKSGRSVGKIYVERGEVTDAQESGESGEKVFLRLAGWKQAQVAFKPGSSSATRTIHRTTMKLLMSSFRSIQSRQSLKTASDAAHLRAKVG